MRKAVFIFAILFCVVGLAQSSSAQSVNVSGSIDKRTVTPGSTARATVVMSIPSSLHVNSSRPASEYAIPTTVRVSGAGIRASRVNYPRGRNRKFEFSENLINVYEGRVSFPFTVTVPANYRGNTITVRAVVRYQACTNEVCYPPTSKTVTMTARVAR